MVRFVNRKIFSLPKLAFLIWIFILKRSYIKVCTKHCFNNFFHLNITANLAYFNTTSFWMRMMMILKPFL
ncbi:hypothetical protein CGJ31_23735 [Vibrio parahaemolyticus]|nr:hypothetical protein CGJ31_23735 [Vibrio parahaemolyticus]